MSVSTTDLVLPETSLWVLSLRRRADAKIVHALQKWLDDDRVIITDLVRIELLQGTKSDEEFDRLKARLDVIPLVTPDAAMWDIAAREAYRLRRQGINLPTVDILIAVVAREVGAELAHHDGHYEMIAPHLGLRTISFLPESATE